MEKIDNIDILATIGLLYLLGGIYLLGGLPLTLLCAGGAMLFVAGIGAFLRARERRKR